MAVHHSVHRHHYPFSVGAGFAGAFHYTNLQSSIFNLQFSIFNLQSSIFNFQFSIFNFQSSIFTVSLFTIVATQESDHTFSAVSTMSMMV